MLKPSMFDKKQNKTLILLVVAGLFLIWQLYALFTGDKKVEPMNTTSNTVMTPAIAAKQLAQKANDTGAAVDPTESQTEYLRLVNEYQMAQLQRMIAESNEAIAVAKQNAVKATLETQKLMGANTVTSNGDGAQNVKGYQLVYTGQQADGQWAATLKKNNQSYDVVVGKQLADGSEIISIDDNGVMLSKDGGKILVTFSGETIAGGKPTVDVEKPITSVENKTASTVSSSIISSAHADTMVNNPPAPAVKTKSPAQEIAKTERTLADAKAVANAQLPDISVGVVDKSNKKNHVATSFEEHMVAFPNIPQQSIAKPTIPVTNTTAKPTLPTSVVPAVNAKQNATQPALQQPLPAMQEANQQLLKSDPTHYTIQLTSDHTIDDVKSFAKDYGLEDKATYFRTEDSQGNDLFVLIYGDFATTADARAALDKMSEEAKGEGAFVIKLSNIQKLLSQS